MFDRLLKVYISCFVVTALVPSALPAEVHTVTIIGTSFNPAAFSVSAGDTVRWVNNSALLHTSTSGTNCTADGIWGSPLLAPGQEFTFVFQNAGVFPYYCQPHCLVGMTGIIDVKVAVPVKDTTWGKIKSLYEQ
jgi:plastocyanin